MADYSQMELHILATMASDIFDNCSVTTGYCVCGNAIEEHSICGGHTPMDMGEYAVSEWRRMYQEVK